MQGRDEKEFLVFKDCSYNPSFSFYWGKERNRLEIPRLRPNMNSFISFSQYHQPC